MTNPWRPSTEHLPTTCVSTWDEDECQSVEVLARDKRDGRYHYFTVYLRHWPEATPKWRTTCSEGWSLEYAFEWRYIEEN